MAHVAPPDVPRNLERVRFRIWQIFMTALTIVVTGWFCTLGVVPAIIALYMTKHVLVAILAMGLNLPQEGITPEKPA